MARPVAWAMSLESWDAAAVHAVLLALTALIALVDAAGGPWLVAPFYVLPVALAAWRLDRGAALGWASLAVLASVAADLAAGPPPPPVLGWNALVHLALLAATILAVRGLRALADFARTIAATDYLTGMLDWISFRELVELERSRALRYNRPFTLAYLDVDRLRSVNESRGHVTGDRTLQLIASVIRENVRSMDSVARLGGDEFALLLPETGQAATEVVLAKLRACLAEAMKNRDLPLTFSIGAVICVGAPESVDRLIQRADALVRAVKERGGDGMALEVLDDPFGIEAILQRG